MRYRSFAIFCMLTLTIIAYSPFSGMAWFSQPHHANSILSFEEQKQRYLLQIKHLRQALRHSEASLEAERKLARDLQRELRDANSQSREMSRNLRELRLQVTKFKRSAHDRSSTTVLANSDSFPNTTVAINLGNKEAQTSLYAPSSKSSFAAAPKKRLEHIRKKTVRFAALKLKNKPSYSDRQQRQKKPLAKQRKPYTKSALKKKRKTISLKRHKIPSRSYTKMRLGKTQRAKVYKSYRPKTKTKTKIRANTKRQMSAFNRFAQRGVFGDGYSTN